MSSENDKIPENSENFFKIFETNTSDWIVSSHDENGQKVVKLGENSTIIDTEREWLYLGTNDETDEESPAKVDDALPKLYIADILRAEYKGKHFIHKSLHFRKVYICGNVISAYPYKEKSAIVVDDGSSNIVCFLKTPETVRDLKDDITSGNNEIAALLSEDKTNSVLKAAYMMAKIAASKMKSIPFGHENFEIGDTVSIIGRLREYSENRYVFIMKIAKHESDSDVYEQHLKDLTYLYDKVY